ncbi:MAG: methyltransferase domain-containing protein [Candidatus Hydrogenedentes bacterium]|nr:methyltransferase domain-containing protein [Candidatus Hydrogenedentota bacterium]
MDSRDLDNQYRRQARWFVGERNRLLRRVDIASKGRVLDLGAGTGTTLADLKWRCGGIAVGLDSDVKSLRLAEGLRVAGTGETLPFHAGSFDLVFTQMFFLWVRDLRQVIAEIDRVLLPGGHLIAAAEPDYGGLIEYPSSSSGLKAYGESLRTEGADVQVARKLGQALRTAGFEVNAGVHPCDPLSRVDNSDGANADQGFLFLPYFHFLCRKPE